MPFFSAIEKTSALFLAIPIFYLIKNKLQGLTLMRSQAKALIALSFGIILLSIAISTNQFEVIQELLTEITQSATAGVPTP